MECRSYTYFVDTLPLTSCSCFTDKVKHNILHAEETFDFGNAATCFNEVNYQPLNLFHSTLFIKSFFPESNLLWSILGLKHRITVKWEMITI